jgi:hypothetical protein
MRYLKLSAARNWLARPLQVILAVPGLLVLASCSHDDGFGKRYPVSGTVSYNGVPLEKGEISFVSEDLTKNYGATGVISNGSYKLSTGGNEDGAQAGKYKVTIKSTEDFAAKAQAAFQKDSGKDNPKLPPTFTAKAAAAAKSLIPPGYGDPRTTTLTAEVEPKPNMIDFKLSDAEAPPPPPKESGAPASRRRDRG